MCSEGYGSLCVCVSVCLCVCPFKPHLTSGASVCCENAVTHSAGKEGQKICGVFSATASLPRLSAPSLGWPYIKSAIFPADNMHAHCAYAIGSRDVMLQALSFTMIIFGLVRVVYLAGYRFSRNSISGTVVLL